MSQTIIEIDNLSKQYRLGLTGTGSLAHDVNRWWHLVRGKEDPYLSVGEKNDRTTKGVSNYVWALRDINFSVNQGEVLGIIGKNGAGKSTLLKILSRTTAPTLGRVKIKGRVASLLEVGTGFHPELSGRDNIFLNGAILGMTRNEIRRKFDEIVDFAGVERYIDTPVKRYSSGMYVRLAFAVAAHLEPEILIVDEVLAVGDADFQKKCLGKMKDVTANQGRTVLFVSHQMGTIAQLCTHSVLLVQGKVADVGVTGKIIESYLVSRKESNEFTYSKTSVDKKIYISEVVPLNSRGIPTDNFGFDESIYLSCQLEMPEKDSGIQVSITLQDKFGYFISTTVQDMSDLPGDSLRKKFLVRLPASIIAPNIYSFRIAIYKIGVDIYDLQENICPIRVSDTGSPMAKMEGVNYGQVILDFKILEPQ
ncbi:MAG TPA: ABC transporter ATP-binding protein [Puia sp.]|uniref:ABC transporter ATP-binding protein n=1 Tax=Puia sp. TaxID=2045100 RepID=UPI002BD899A8|nr:ABC transporter ATP-binding protein [Puia sp.]HVU98924.1 ABC transporter ATP-binding protein [Puia sp.]